MKRELKILFPAVLAGLGLLAIVYTSIEKPTTENHTLQQLGITEATFDHEVTACGRDMKGGEFMGQFKGQPVSGHFCCDFTRCYYSLD